MRRTRTVGVLATVVTTLACAELSAVLGHREQHRSILNGLKSVPGVRDDDQVTRCAVPGRVSSGESNPAGEHVHGGLTGVLVLLERLTRGQRDDGLAQHVLVPAVHGCGATPAGGRT